MRPAIAAARIMNGSGSFLNLQSTIIVTTITAILKKSGRLFSNIVRRPNTMPDLTNLFCEIPEALPQELVQTLLGTSTLRIERIVSKGHASAEDFWYDQDEHEWVLLVSGSARLQFEDGFVELGVGDFVNIPAHKKHRVDWTDPDETTIWLAVLYA
jgi:cupin 2 domain-containing protein